MRRLPVEPEVPREGQESVWDYPRPPALEPSTEEVVVRLAGRTVATTRTSFRVLETSHPPTYYLPAEAFADGVLRLSARGAGASWCEWKGAATYLDLVADPADPVSPVAARAAWTYPDPTPSFAPLRGHVSLYPGLVAEVLVDGERVRPQPGSFYGGWVTSRVVGPFKGEPGTMGW